MFSTPGPSAPATSRLAGLARAWWVIPAAIAIASRIWGSTLVYASGATSWTGFTTPPAVGPATTWDGAWYLSIARTGYHAAPLLGSPTGGYHDFAFWPAWPTVLAPVLQLVPDAWIDVTASLLANLIAIVALVLWARVLTPVFGRRDALWAIAFVGFAPPGFILSMAYSEPLFLLVTGAFFLSGRDSIRRPLLAALAQATRVTGFAAGASAIPSLIRARGRDRQGWLILLAPLVVFAAWWLFLANLTGSATGFMLGTPNWLHVTGQEAGPLGFFPDIARDSRYGRPILIWAVFTTLVVVGCVRLFRRHLAEFGWYSLGLLVPTLLFAAWQSMPRHSLVAVPAIAAVIQPLPPRWRVPLLALSMLAEIVVCESMVGIRLISP